ncbi:MAG: cytochrome c family protein [Acidobacteriota bacterium]
MRCSSGLSGLALLSTVLLSMPPLLAAEGAHSYVGSKKCKMCHIREWKSWSQTKMAKAFELLKPGIRGEQKEAAGLDPAKDYTADPECVSCHSTGYGKPGGFVDLETTPDLAGVGCEMCHGAGGTYTQKQYMSLQNKNYKKQDLAAVGLVGTITAQTCRGLCHNNKSPFVGEDYVFDFEARRNQGAHERFPLKYQH